MTFQFRATALLLILLSVISCHRGEKAHDDSTFKGKSSAEEKIVDGQWVRGVINQRYAFYDDYSRDRPTVSLLFSERFDVTTRQSMEGSESQLHVDVYSGEQGRYDKLLWK